MSLTIAKPKHDHSLRKFPEGFLWGAATSAYQVEGNNIHSDWWAWEQNRPANLRSGLAADQYNRYEQDFDLAKKLQHNAHRLSLEWSRIEPEEGLFNVEAIEHYQQVLQALKKHDFTVMLTLWHFTLPEWLAKKGGWENPKTAWYFERFVKKIVPEFASDVDLWITINEPGVYAWAGYLEGKWPPNVKSYWRNIKVYWNMTRGHRKAYQAIHQTVPKAKVGIAQNVVSFGNMQAHSLSQHLLVWLYDWIINHMFYVLSNLKTHDFLGLNYYMHQHIGYPKGARLPHFIDASWAKKEASDMGWEIYPEGIFDVLKDFSDYNKPIYITENGIASTNDDRKCRFLLAYVKEIYHAIAAGIDVKGYFYWSLLDNYEWSDGFGPRFGLIEVDYATQKRIPRLSATVYAEIIKRNGIPHELLRFLGHTIDAEEVLAYLHKNEVH